MTYILHLGDCIEVLRTIPDCSVESIVTDPPYGLTNKSGGPSGSGRETPHARAKAGATTGGFMGLKWDSDVPPVDVWIECLRVLKPGGHLLAFAGTRTQHRMATRIEDAGFHIRDMIAWVYGSGFPKSHNGEWGGTALKPALEPITVARKPLIGTVEANWREHGTGALNIDGCRISTNGGNSTPEVGRWPANLIHDGSDEVLNAFPDAPGQIANASTNHDARKTQNVYGALRRGRGDEPSADRPNDGAVGFKMKPGARRLDSGTAARFFYCAKASRTDRNEGLTDPGPQFKQGTTLRDVENTETTGNTHPTVKPTELMAYLCRLVTPPGGTVLDPFMGSGSTGKAAVREGFNFIGIDITPEYLEIAESRIEHAFKKADPLVTGNRQFDMFSHAPSGSIQEPEDENSEAV